MKNIENIFESRNMWIFQERIGINKDGDFYPLNGAQRIALELFKHFSQTKKCHLITILPPTLDFPSQKTFTECSSLISRGSGIKYKITAIPKCILNYIKYIHKTKPNVVLSMNPLTNIIALFLSLFVKTEPILSVHGMPSFINQNKIFSILTHITYTFIAKPKKIKFIAVSNGVKSELETIYKISEKNIRVIYNPIDVKKIRSEAQSCDIVQLKSILQNEIPVIITAGRLVTIKAQQHLIRSFAALRRERSACLLICGAGVEEAYLKRLAKNLDIADDVLFLGWQENPYKYMAHSTVFVLSSLSEAFGNVLVEAMASGCPVITANCSSGVREIIGENNEYGLLAEQMTGIRHNFNDMLDSGEKSLLELMRKIIDDKELREKYIKIGKERADYFSIERRIKEYDCLF